MTVIQTIQPDWPAPKNVRAFTTTRIGGISKGPYASFNLSDSGEDDTTSVAYNRTQLAQTFNLPSTPKWIKQVHGTTVVNAAQINNSGIEADASYANKPGVICNVLTADCLPVLLCDSEGKFVAAIHAGWRGLVAGVIEVTRDHIESNDILAWLGPAIGPNAFEVGDDVRDLFLRADKEAESGFVSLGGGKWLCDLYHLAKQRLHRCGIGNIYGGDHCTYEERELFYSYRRDGVTGRMASVIWRSH